MGWSFTGRTGRAIPAADPDGVGAATLQWDFDQIVLAHGPVITHEARGVVEGAFAWLQKAERHPREKAEGRRG